jgi:hypothetical protein
MWGIPYRIVALMMADAPSYDYDSEEKKEEKQVIRLTNENAQLMLQNMVENDG